MKTKPYLNAMLSSGPLYLYFPGSTVNLLLPFIFALAELFIHLESSFLGIGERERFGRIKGRKEFAHRLFAGRALGQFLGVKGSAQRKLAAADLAIALAEFVFVKWHDFLSNYTTSKTAKRCKLVWGSRICFGESRHCWNESHSLGPSRPGCLWRVGRQADQTSRAKDFWPA